MPTYEPPRELPERVLSDPEMIRACSARDFTSVFRFVKHHAGIYPALIARRCDLTPSRVGEVLSGRRIVKDMSVVERIADGLRIPGQMLGLTQRAWEGKSRECELASPAPPTVRKHVPPSVSPGSPDRTAVESFRAADRQLGGGHLYGSVLLYLHKEMAPRIFGSKQAPDTSQMFQAAAALTEMAGWMAHDSGRNGQAREHFTKALPLARAGGDRALGANVMASMSHLALQLGQLEEAVSLARAGRDHVASGPRVPTLTARLHAMEARALAQRGEAEATRHALDLAERELTKATDGTPSYWISSFDDAALASETALSLQDLGTLPAAVAAAENAIALRTGDRARSRVFGQITLAKIRTQQGEVEAACAVGHELLMACGTLGSMRITQQLDELASSLAPYRGERVVARFLDCLTAVNQQRALLLAGISAPHGGGTTT
ncbi:tetratricopeptide repeat protein [Streptomyces sp. NPDC050147]|uniref:tetratricopeptide repeat protein n=1 Tax=Streptomyces sp. NPDC050147 TaxID=3155513 RepID=UPI003425C9A1